MCQDPTAGRAHHKSMCHVEDSQTFSRESFLQKQGCRQQALLFPPGIARWHLKHGTWLAAGGERFNCSELRILGNNKGNLSFGVRGRYGEERMRMWSQGSGSAFGSTRKIKHKTGHSISISLVPKIPYPRCHLPSSCHLHCYQEKGGLVWHLSKADSLILDAVLIDPTTFLRHHSIR